MKQRKGRGLSAAVTVILFVATAGAAWAHCDTKSGPVAMDARRALESGEFKTVAIWVGEAQHEELRAMYDQCLSVYELGGEAQKLAELHFMETAVRLHRQAEGLPYTGLKGAQPPPRDVAMAERALDTGNLEPVAQLLEDGLEKELEALFMEARKKRKKKDESLNAGREWADAYVRYVIYVHGLHATILAGPQHGVGE